MSVLIHVDVTFTQMIIARQCEQCIFYILFWITTSVKGSRPIVLWQSITVRYDQRGWKVRAEAAVVLGP